MTIEIPDWLKTVSEYVAGDFPEADEDALRRLAEAYRAAAHGIEGVTANGNRGADEALAALEGEIADKFGQMWQQIARGGEAGLPKVQHLCEQLGKQCDDTALDVEYTKLTVIASLVALVIQLAVMAAMAFFTAGASTAGGAAATAATRSVVMQVIRQLIQKIASREIVGLLAKNIAIELGTSLAVDGFAQGYQIASGERKGYDGGKLGQAAVQGVVGGVVGAGFEAGGQAVAKRLGATAGKATGDAVGEAAAHTASEAAGAAGSAGVARSIAGKAIAEGASGMGEGAVGGVIGEAQSAAQGKDFDWGNVGKQALGGAVTGAAMGGAAGGAEHAGLARAAAKIDTNFDTSMSSADTGSSGSSPSTSDSGGSAHDSGGGSSSGESSASRSAPASTGAQSAAAPPAPPAHDAPASGAPSTSSAPSHGGQQQGGGQSFQSGGPASVQGAPAAGSPVSGGAGSTPGTGAGSTTGAGGMRSTGGMAGGTPSPGSTPSAGSPGSSQSSTPSPSTSSAPSTHSPSAGSSPTPGTSAPNPSTAGSPANSPHPAAGSPTPNPASGAAPHTPGTPNPGASPTTPGPAQGAHQTGGPSTPGHSPAQGISPTGGTPTSTPHGTPSPGSGRSSTSDGPAPMAAQGLTSPTTPARPTSPGDTSSPHPSRSTPSDGPSSPTHQPGANAPATPGPSHTPNRGPAPETPRPSHTTPGQPGGQHNVPPQRGNPSTGQSPRAGASTSNDGPTHRSGQLPGRGTTDTTSDHAQRPAETNRPSSPTLEGTVADPPGAEPGSHESGGSSRPRDLLDDPKQTAWARDAYEHFRGDSQDVDEVARSTQDFVREDGTVGFSSEEIADVKQHLFDTEHLIEDYETGEVVRRSFDPDADIADAWVRLRNGTPLPEDFVLLQHELRELTYLRDNPGATYQEAHRHANEQHNWQSQVPDATRENYENHRENADGSDRLLQEDQRGRAVDPLQLRSGTRPDGQSPDLRQDHAPVDPAGRSDRSRVPGRVQEDHHHAPGSGNLAGEGHARELSPEHGQSRPQQGSTTRPEGLDENRPPRHSGARSDDPPARPTSPGDPSRPHPPGSPTPFEGPRSATHQPGHSPAAPGPSHTPNRVPGPGSVGPAAGTPHPHTAPGQPGGQHNVPPQRGNPSTSPSHEAGAPLRQPGTDARPAEPHAPRPAQPGTGHGNAPSAPASGHAPTNPHSPWGHQPAHSPSHQPQQGPAPHPRSTPESLAAERPPANPWAHSLHRNGETSADMNLPPEMHQRLGGDVAYITPNECGVMVMKEPPDRAHLFTPVPPDPKRFTIQVHADPTSAYLGDRKLSAKELADIIRGTPGYAPGTPVRMVACNAGRPLPNGAPNLAQQLSHHLGAEVLAGDQTIWANHHGISTAGGSQMRPDNFGVPTPHLDQPGRWHVFRPDGPPITHNSPHPPGHVTEYEKARQHSERNIRSGTWDPNDPYLPRELRHPGGGPGSKLIQQVDPSGRRWAGHDNGYGQPVWHGNFDSRGNWTPHGRFDHQGRFVPGHYENGRLVDNGHYTAEGGWVGKGRFDEHGRWIPMEFDGTHLRDTGRYDARGRWFSAGHYDPNGMWRPHGRFDPDTGRWIPNPPPPPHPGQGPHPGPGPRHPGPGPQPGPRHPGNTRPDPAAPTPGATRPDGARPAPSPTPGVPDPRIPAQSTQHQTPQDSSPRIEGSGQTAEPPARGASDRASAQAAEAPNQAPRRSTAESMAQEPARDRANDVSWEERGPIRLSDELIAKLCHTRDADRGYQAYEGFNRELDDRPYIKPTKSGLSLVRKDPNVNIDRTIGAAAPDPNRFTVEAHGGPNGVRVGRTTVNAKELAEILRAAPGYKEGTPVRLLSCQTGGDAGGGPNFAKQLAAELGVDVLAPTSNAWVDNFGNMYASDTRAKFDDSSGAPRPTFRSPGQWVSHSPDGTTATHDSPYPPGHRPEWTRKTPGTGTEFRPHEVGRRGGGGFFDRIRSFFSGRNKPDEVDFNTQWAREVGVQPNPPAQQGGWPQQQGWPNQAAPQQGWPQQAGPHQGWHQQQAAPHQGWTQQPAAPAPGGPMGSSQHPPGPPSQPGPHASTPGAQHPGQPQGRPMPPGQGFPSAPGPGGPTQQHGPRPQGNVPPPGPARQPGPGMPPQGGHPRGPVPPPGGRPATSQPSGPQFPHQQRLQGSIHHGQPSPGPHAGPGQAHPQHTAGSPAHPQPQGGPGQHPAPPGTPNAAHQQTAPPSQHQHGFGPRTDGGFGPRGPEPSRPDAENRHSPASEHNAPPGERASRNRPSWEDDAFDEADTWMEDFHSDQSKFIHYDHDDFDADATHDTRHELTTDRSPEPRDVDGSDPGHEVHDRGHEPDADGSSRPKIGDLVPTDEHVTPEQVAEVTNQIKELVDGDYAGLKVQVEADKLTVEQHRIIVRAVITDANNVEVGSARRAFERHGDALVAMHENLQIKPHVQGFGFATEFNGRLESWYRESGVSHIYTHANVDVGGYKWARDGFNFRNEQQVKELILPSLKREIRNAENELQSKQDQCERLPDGPEKERMSRENFEEKLRIDSVKSIRARIEDPNIPFGSPDYPSAYKISQAGRDPNREYGVRETWIGKAALLNTHWHGVKKIS